MSTTLSTSLDELRFRLHGSLHEPGDPHYEDACTVNNAMVDKRPRYVVRCMAADCITAALAFAAEQGLEVAVRAGGHSVTGASLCDDGLVLDVRPMNAIAIDAERRVARVGAGCTWADLDRAAQAHGLATTGGRVSTTGVVGLTLGGGSGWLERKHGLACDNLLAADLVTADGRLVRASADEHPELLWALRGGGGNFGVVTAVELALHPMPAEILAGLALWPIDRAREVLAGMRDLMGGAPEELGIVAMLCSAPAEEFVPAELHGEPAIIIAGLYAGAVADGEAALAPLRALEPVADLFEPTTYADFQCALDDPPGFRNYWTSDNLRELPDAAIDLVVERAVRFPTSPTQILIAPWGGALSRVTADESPLAGRDAGWVVHPFVLWSDPDDDDRMMALGRGFRDDLRPFAMRDTYLNFIGDEGADRVRRGFGDANYERLAAIKAAWDPGNVLRGNQNIVPAAKVTR